MDLQMYQWGYLLVAIVLANLPWLSQRCFLIVECAHKSAWIRLLEWLLLYLVIVDTQ